VLAVPIGTVVLSKTQFADDTEIADLLQHCQPIVVARGGRGGLGNTHFASSTNQVPRIAQKGWTGEATSIILELRLIADVGMIGYPNVGKSSLLTKVSAAKPQIANYPFTTLEPALGVVETSQRSFIIAEIPGLIAGAHLGRGQGHGFLRRVVRTKVLLHVIDGSSASLVEDMIQINSELSLFDSALAQKPQLIVVNKIDLPQVRVRLAETEDAFRNAGTKVQFISATTGEGVAELMARVWAALDQVTIREKDPSPPKVFRPKPKRAGISVRKKGDAFVVAASELERVVAGTDLRDLEARRQLLMWLIRAGLSRTLEKAGAKPGDRVRLGELEWVW
jgi:GTP-binding protein